MACCLTAPSHYLNQCWLLIHDVEWQSPESNTTRDTLTINYWNKIRLKITHMEFHTYLWGVSELKEFRQTQLALVQSDLCVHQSISNVQSCQPCGMCPVASDGTSPWKPLCWWYTPGIHHWKLRDNMMLTLHWELWQPSVLVMMSKLAFHNSQFTVIKCWSCIHTEPTDLAIFVSADVLAHNGAWSTS